MPKQPKQPKSNAWLCHIDQRDQPVSYHADSYWVVIRCRQSVTSDSSLSVRASLAGVGLVLESQCRAGYL